MNVQAPLRLEQTSRSLEGKVSLVTGSTSGIGLGIARALAAAGSSVVLNGFGKPEDIAEVQAKIVSEFGVKVRYSPADMSKAAPIADMIALMLDTFGRRHPTRRATRAISGREVGRDFGHQPFVGVPHHARCAAIDA